MTVRAAFRSSHCSSFASSGDSGAGLKWEYTIDGLVLQSDFSGEILGQTAYDVKTQLGGGFDFNCAVGQATNTASGWGSCPVVNR